MYIHSTVFKSAVKFRVFSVFQKMRRLVALYYRVDVFVHYKIWAYIAIPYSTETSLIEGRYGKSERTSVHFN